MCPHLSSCRTCPRACFGSYGYGGSACRQGPCTQCSEASMGSMEHVCATACACCMRGRQQAGSCPSAAAHTPAPRTRAPAVRGACLGRARCGPPRPGGCPRRRASRTAAGWWPAVVSSNHKLWMALSASLELLQGCTRTHASRQQWHSSRSVCKPHSLAASSGRDVPRKAGHSCDTVKQFDNGPQGEAQRVRHALLNCS
jgi:hypothetical protein